MITYKFLLSKPFLKVVGVFWFFWWGFFFMRQPLIWQEFVFCPEITLTCDLADDILFLWWKGAEKCQNYLWDMRFESAHSELNVILFVSEFKFWAHFWLILCKCFNVRLSHRVSKHEKSVLELKAIKHSTLSLAEDHWYLQNPSHQFSEDNAGDCHRCF